MKYKEKEKLWLQCVKEECKAEQWKFKGYFIFKALNDFFFSSTFYVSRNENSISGWLGYKPMSIDNVFWDIINEQPNKKMPLSFRAEGAFCVREVNFFDYQFNIETVENPEREIRIALAEINKKVSEKTTFEPLSASFNQDTLKDEKRNSAAIVTWLIDQRLFDEAILKIKEFKEKNYGSGFGIGDKDFYDLANDYCEKNYR